MGKELILEINFGSTGQAPSAAAGLIASKRDYKQYLSITQDHATPSPLGLNRVEFLQLIVLAEIAVSRKVFGSPLLFF